MADQFAITGTYTIQPIDGNLSLEPSVEAIIDEALVFSRKIVATITLTVDTPVAVAFNGMTSAHVVILSTVGGKVTARFTSADGATQAIPVDSSLIIISRTVPFTAIDLTRVASTTTDVRVVLGQKA